MNRNLLVLCLIPALAGVSLTARAEDGKQLHDANCVSCHKSDVYTRADRKVKSLAALDAQVLRCETSQGLNWQEQQRKAVTDYLNTSFYKFGKDKS